MKNTKVVDFILLSAVAVSSILFFEGCGSMGGGTPPPPATTGALSLSIGFGAGSSGGSACTGGGTVTISGPAANQSQNYGFSGFSASTSPACSTGATFGNLKPGTWTIKAGAATCQASVVAGQFASVTLRTDTGTCQ